MNVWTSSVQYCWTATYQITACWLCPDMKTEHDGKESESEILCWTLKIANWSNTVSMELRSQSKIKTKLICKDSCCKIAHWLFTMTTCRHILHFKYHSFQQDKVSCLESSTILFQIWLQLTSNCAERKAFLQHRGQKLNHLWKKKCWQTFQFRILKSVLYNRQSARNNIKNWREITSKNSRFLIAAVLKINFQKLVSKFICPTMYSLRRDCLCLMNNDAHNRLKKQIVDTQTTYFWKTLWRKFDQPDWGLPRPSSVLPCKCSDSTLIGPELLLPDSLQFIIQLSSYHQMLYSIENESIIKQTTTKM
jgi:hypothetical protein